MRIYKIVLRNVHPLDFLKILRGKDNHSYGDCNYREEDKNKISIVTVYTRLEPEEIKSIKGVNQITTESIRNIQE